MNSNYMKPQVLSPQCCICLTISFPSSLLNQKLYMYKVKKGQHMKNKENPKAHSKLFSVISDLQGKDIAT